MKKQIAVIAALLLTSIGVYAHGPRKEITVTVTDKGFEPKSVDVEAGTHVILKVTRKTDATCSKRIQVPSLKIPKLELPLNQEVSVYLGKVKKGEIKFGCGMDMMDSAQINVN